ncbi:cyclin-dependent kinase 2-interacting protein-like [Battus philenor]|uniref:cyclin-dependent kinase 2-interacting protein-like n=1 Tax=Battus philenor TaxID=42288 RepID=UPI0035D045EC
MSKTPNKTTESVTQFSPKDLISPNKETSGVSKTVFTHISNIHSLLCKWLKIIDKGSKVVKSISALKLHECYDDYYPYQLNTLTVELVEATDALKNILESIEILGNQLQVLVKLHPANTAVINTWSAAQVSRQVSNIYSSLCKEYNLKRIIRENIAHCRDENLIEVYVSAWEQNVYISLDLTAYMFEEVGLSRLSIDT